MIMDNVFNIKRFWNVLQHDFFLSWKMLALNLAFPLVLWLALYCISDNRLRATGYQDYVYHDLAVTEMYVAVACFALLVIISGFAFKPFADKRKRFDALSMPASLLEKMLSRLVLFALIPLLIYSIHAVLYYHLPAMQHYVADTPAEYIWLTLSLWYWAAVMLMAMATFWSAIIKAFVLGPPLAILALAIVLAPKLESRINMYMIDSIVRYIHSGDTLSRMLVVEGAVAMLFGLISFAASYWILSRKQIR